MSWDDEVDARSGGLLLGYTGTVTDAYFGEGSFGPQLYVDVLLDHPEDHPQIKDGVIHNWIGIGNGWEIVKNGSEVKGVSVDGKDAPTKFNGNTLAGRIVKQIQAIDPDGATLANGTTRQASFWKGLGHAVWGSINIPRRVRQIQNEGGVWVDDKGGEWRDVPEGKDVSMPVELLGTTASNGTGSFDIAALAIPADTLGLLTSAAAASTSHGDFVSKAVQVPGVLGAPFMEKLGNSMDGPKIFDALKAF